MNTRGDTSMKMVMMRKKKTAGRRWPDGLAPGTAVALLLLAGCGSSAPPPAKSGSDLLGESKPGAEQIIPQEKKRDITPDQKADFGAAMERYQAAKKSGGLSTECGSISDSFRAAADANPNVLEARFNQAAVLQECGREAEAVRIWEGMTDGKSKYGPAITNLGYIAWKNGDTSRAESLFSKAIDADPLHTVEARNNLAQILRDKARKTSSPDEKRQLVGQAVSHLRTVLALDSNNLQAFSTLSFIYFELNMLEMAKLVGNQAIRKADEIATGKFEEEKGEETGDVRNAKGGKKAKKKEDEEDSKLTHQVDVREAGTGVTPQMKQQLAVVHNTLGLVELRKKNISPAISQFRQAVELNPAFNEARLNLAALSLNNRDYRTAEENFQAVLQAQPKNYEAMIGLGVALRGGKKIAEAETQYVAAQQMDPQNPSSYFNLGLLYQDYKDGQKPALQKAQEYYRQFLGKANGSTPDGLRRDAEKRIKDIDEIYVALAEAAKLQAEAEEMQRKAEEQQKQMEEQMKKQQADEAAASSKTGDAKPADGAAGAAPADAASAGAASAPPPAAGGKKKKRK